VSRKEFKEIKDGIPGLVVRETLLNLRGIQVTVLGLGQVRGRESRQLSLENGFSTLRNFALIRASRNAAI
jgi:hypothetical protein